ncbi:hypothetical protein TNCV_402131 [Trichonephila clavipes]|nr:hypothetical protein TNCV_402131 [Trichonephila clavipes]
MRQFFHPVWAPRSSELNTIGYWLWSYLESYLYRNCTTLLGILKQNIRCTNFSPYEQLCSTVVSHPVMGALLLHYPRDPDLLEGTKKQPYNLS